MATVSPEPTYVAIVEIQSAVPAHSITEYGKTVAIPRDVRELGKIVLRDDDLETLALRAQEAVKLIAST